MSPCQHFVKNDPEREEVTALIDLAPVNLFRRHVRYRAEIRPERLRRGLTPSSVVRAVNVESVVSTLSGWSIRDVGTAPQDQNPAPSRSHQSGP